MAIIRIIDLPENSRSLIDELRARGFTVLTGSDGGTESADVEISVEECPVEEALEKCAETGEPAAVFIAPGAVDDGWRPIAVVPLIPEVPVAAERMEPVVMISAEPETAQASSDVQTFQAVNIQNPGLVETHVWGVVQSAANAVSETSLPDPMPVISTPVIASAADAEVVHVYPVPVGSLPVDPSVALPNDAETENPANKELHADETSNSGLTSDWPIWNPLSDPVFAMNEPGSENDVAQAAVYSSPPTVGRRQSWKIDETLFWKAAPAAAALALFALLAITIAHRISPLPQSITQRQNEEQGQQVPLSRTSQHDAHLQKVSVESALVPDKRSERQQSQPRSSVLPAGVSAASQRSRLSSTSSTTARSDGGFVARDTVVRYPAKASTKETSRKPAENGKRSDIRRYSDLPTAAR